MAEDPLNDALTRAIFIEEDLQKVKNLIAAGADVHMEVGSFQKRGSLLLGCNDASIARELLLNGVSVNRSNGFRETPLHVACTGRKLKSTMVVKELLKFGAGVNDRDCKGNTPLNIAVNIAYRNYDTIQLLLEYGADINLQNWELKFNDNHNSPLDNAVDRFPIAHLLVKMSLIQNFSEKLTYNNPAQKYMRENKIDKPMDLFMTVFNGHNELIRMQTDMVTQQTSLYELITKKTMNLYLSDNNELVKKIQEKMTERYPQYHDIISDKIKSCVLRWKLLNMLRNLKFFPALETSEKKQTIVLDADSVHNIAKYLSTIDLCNLINALRSDASKYHVKDYCFISNCPHCFVPIPDTSPTRKKRPSRMQGHQSISLEKQMKLYYE